MEGEQDSILDALARTRALFAALKDERGARSCDLAMARELRDDDPMAVLASLREVLDRMASAGEFEGLEVLSAEAILAARAIGAEDIEAGFRAMVAGAGSADLAARVLDELWTHSQTARDDGDAIPGVRASRAALDLSVALDDFRAAAISLLLLSGCHDLEGRREAADLCMRQAGLYLARAGEFETAGDCLLEAAGGARGGDPSRLIDQAVTAYRSAPDPAASASRLLDAAGVFLARADARHAMRLVEPALDLLAGSGSSDLEARAWRLAAAALRALGDDEEARGAEARAELIGGGER